MNITGAGHARFGKPGTPAPIWWSLGDTFLFEGLAKHVHIDSIEIGIHDYREKVVLCNIDQS